MRLLAILRITLLELRHGKLLVLPLTVAMAIAIVGRQVQHPADYGDGLILGTWTAISIAGGLVAILTASGVIASEVERGTMLLLASRPVSRTTILVGKALGVGIYLLLCGALWGSVLAATLGPRIAESGVVLFAGSLLAMVPAAFAGLVALAASTCFPARGAVGASAAAWLAAAFVASIPIVAVRPENRERVELTQAIVGWVMPSGRLGELPSLALGATMPPGTWLALLVMAAWAGLAALLFATRRSLAR